MPRQTIVESNTKAGLTVREAAAMLGIGQATLYERIGPDATSVNVGWTDIRLLRIGRRIIIPRAEVERALCEQVSA